MASDVHMDSPYPASASPDRVPVPRLARVPVPPPDRAADPSPGPDTPVRVEVEMPRDLYDRLTSYDDAPRCRYDMATGRAEFVAEPSESLQPVSSTALEDAGHPLRAPHHRCDTSAERRRRVRARCKSLPGPGESAVRGRISRTISIRARATPYPISWPRSIEASIPATSSRRTSGWACARRGPGVAATACTSGSPTRNRHGDSGPRTGAGCCRVSTGTSSIDSLPPAPLRKHRSVPADSPGRSPAPCLRAVQPAESEDGKARLEFHWKARISTESRR